jgi:transcriptional regulator with XRE-family HTH domain
MQNAIIDGSQLINRIYEVCKLKNIRISQMESDLSLGQSYIKRWTQVKPNYNTVVSIAKYLDVSVDFLTGRSDMMSVADEVLNDPTIVTIQRKREVMSDQQKKKFDETIKALLQDDD